MRQSSTPTSILRLGSRGSPLALVQARQAQSATAKACGVRPDLRIAPLRGNVETRLRKIEAGEVDTTVLAAAGLKRLGLLSAASAVLEVEEFLPAAGQGAIALETRADDDKTRALIAAIGDADTATALAAERAFLAALGGSCRTPIAGHAQIRGDTVSFRGLIATIDGSDGV